MDFTQMEEGGIMRYYLPKLDDSPGDKPYVLSSNMEEFMYYDNQNNSIVMTNLTRDKIG